jgi:hypothetical protein
MSDIDLDSQIEAPPGTWIINRFDENGLIFVLSLGGALIGAEREFGPSSR